MQMENNHFLQNIIVELHVSIFRWDIMQLKKKKNFTAASIFILAKLFCLCGWFSHRKTIPYSENKNISY